MKLPLPSRIPIIYLTLIVLITVGVVPLYIYATKVLELNREKMERNEKLLQNMVTTSLADTIAEREMEVRDALTGLASAVELASGGDLRGVRVKSPEIRSLLQESISNPDSIVPYAQLVNAQNNFMSVGTIESGAFLEKELARGMAAARDLREYSGEALSVGSGKQSRTVMVVSKPVVSQRKEYLGALQLVVDLEYLVTKLEQTRDRQGLETFVVDRSGRLVASASLEYATGQDMNFNDLVKNFVERSGNAPRFPVTTEYSLPRGKTRVRMLGTYFAVPGLEWGVVTQKTRDDAYVEIFDMRRDALRFAVVAIAFSVFISIWAARRLTTPLGILTESSRSLAARDFSKRVELNSRTEFGELVETFNTMTGELERFVADLKKTAEENRTLFSSSIQMLAGAVDEKDPYSRGHSDRVTRYSVLVATELALKEDEIERIRISAQLHDVGKIGIEDRILKKPGALTPEEFEIMKTHTTKGAAILHPVDMLREMIPGIALHHESLDGRGYPFGLKGDQIPLMPRIIMVADTFDAMTTNRPYQAAMDPEYVIHIINSLASTKFDPVVVAAMTKVFESGKLRFDRAATLSSAQAAAAAAVASAAEQ